MYIYLSKSVESTSSEYNTYLSLIEDLSLIEKTLFLRCAYHVVVVMWLVDVVREVELEFSKL